AGEPGWAMTVKGAVAAVLPAASAHLASLVSERLIPLARGRAGEATAARTLLTAGLAPSDAEERLAPWLGRPGPVAVSSAVVDGDVWVRLLARGVSRAAAADALARAERDVAGALGDDCYGADGDSLEAALGRLLAARGLTVSAAESCTGGLVAERLTGVPGASRYFERGAVAYSSGAIA